MNKFHLNWSLFSGHSFIVSLVLQLLSWICPDLPWWVFVWEGVPIHQIVWCIEWANCHHFTTVRYVFTLFFCDFCLSRLPMTIHYALKSVEVWCYSFKSQKLWKDSGQPNLSKGTQSLKDMVDLNFSFHSGRFVQNPKCFPSVFVILQVSYLQENNISHLGKRKVIFKSASDMFVPWRVL